MSDAPEEKIHRAFRRSGSVIVVLALIVVGVYFIVRIPKTRPVDPTPAVGPVDLKESRTELAQQQVSIPFVDIAAESGLIFTHITGAQGGKLLPETMVGGVAVFDADGDGRQDIAFACGTAWTGQAFESDPVAGASSVSLFLNTTARRAGAAISFAKALDCGLTTNIYGMGMAAGDYDGDGRIDLYVTGVGSNQLFQNQTAVGGSPRFIDVTASAAADPKWDHSRWGTSAGFFDADGDGDLDLLVANYVQWSPELDRAVDFQLAGVGRAYGPPTGFEGDDVLFLSNNGNGTFADATKTAGFAVRNSLGHRVGKALAIVFVDPDQDGDLDVVVANDTTANGFFVNNGAGHFTERAAASGLAFDRNGSATAAMGIDSGYLRSKSLAGGEDLAIAIGNFANEPDSLFISRGKTPIFTDDAVVEGLAAPSRAVLTFGLLLTDLDLDGDLDLVQTNGHIEDQINRIQPSQTYAQRGQVFLNTGSTAPCFIELPASAIGDLATPRIGRGLAAGDFDLDGDVDLVLTQSGGPVALLRNDFASTHHWIGIDCGPHAIGTHIEIEALGIVQRRLISPTRSYLTQCATPALFGLGNAKQVDRLTIRWPDGQTQTVPVEKMDHTILLHPPAIKPSPQ